MAKFRKKPVVVEAVQYQPERVNEIPELIVTHGEPGANYGSGIPGAMVSIRTLEGTMRVRPGDWIITGVAGERYPCRDDIFKATYEPLES